MEFLLDGIRAVTPQQCVMYVVGALLIYLAIKKDYEPSLLLPMGFGAILVNLPMSGVLNQMVAGVGESQGIIQWLFETTIEASEAARCFQTRRCSSLARRRSSASSLR